MNFKTILPSRVQCKNIDVIIKIGVIIVRINTFFFYRFYTSHCPSYDFHVKGRSSYRVRNYRSWILILLYNESTNSIYLVN